MAHLHLKMNVTFRVHPIFHLINWSPFQSNIHHNNRPPEDQELSPCQYNKLFIQHVLIHNVYIVGADCRYLLKSLHIIQVRSVWLIHKACSEVCCFESCFWPRGKLFFPFADSFIDLQLTLSKMCWLYWLIAEVHQVCSEVCF